MLKKFLVTNTKRWQGTAELHYKNEELFRICFYNCNIEATTLAEFLKIVPTNTYQLATAFSKGTVVVESEYQVTFEQFWQAYNKKTNKKRAEDFWNKMPNNLRVLAFIGVKKYLAIIKRTNVYQCDPHTFLKDERYNDEN